MSAAPDIFLSYSRDDQARAKMFAAAFEAEGFSVWWDVGLRTGEAYDEVTETALRTAKAVVVLWSKRSVQSRWVRAEATLADRNKTLAPAMIEACERPIMFELVHTADLSAWQGDLKDASFQAFIADLKGFVAKPVADGGMALQAQAALRRAVVPGLPRINRRVAIAAGLGLTGVVGFVAWQGSWRKPATQPAAAVPQVPSAGPPILAVLPFMTLTKKDDDIAFADGLHEDLLSRLANISGLRVIARASVLGFANSTKRVSAIAAELGVGSIVTGSVQRDAGMVKVSVQLVNARSEMQVWGTSYERPLTTKNLFLIQRDLTEAIAGKLGTLLTAEEMQAAFSGGTRNLDAYEAYASGLKAFNDLRISSSIAAFTRATEIDPTFSAAFAQISLAAGQLYWLSNRTDTAMLELTRASADRARALAPRAVETRHANAWLRYISGDFAGARRLLEPLMHEVPNNSAVLYAVSLTVRRLGDLKTARSIGERAAILNPLSQQTQWNLVSTLGFIGDFAAAQRRVASCRQRWPRSRVISVISSDVQLSLGDLRGANQLLWQVDQDDDDERFFGVRLFLEKALFLAVALRDATLIRRLLARLPEYRLHSLAPHAVDLFRAEAAYGMGEVALARDIASRIPPDTAMSQQERWRVWGAYSILTPAVGFGITGDLGNLRRSAHDLDTTPMPDKLAEIWMIRIALAIAFARAGDPDSAMAQIRSMELVRGPCLFLTLSVLPDLAVLRTRSDWRALQRRYQDWAKTQEPWQSEVNDSGRSPG